MGVSSQTQHGSCPKHILLEFIVGDVLLSVSPWGRCVIMPQIAKLSKKSQINGFKICELIFVCKLPLV